MDTDKLEELEKKYYQSENNTKIGLYIIGVGLVAVIVNALGWVYDTQIMQGVVLGGGFVFWGVNFDKKQKVKKELDSICFLKYGKNYKESIPAILNDRYASRYLRK